MSGDGTTLFGRVSFSSHGPSPGSSSYYPSFQLRIGFYRSGGRREVDPEGSTNLQYETGKGTGSVGGASGRREGLLGRGSVDKCAGTRRRSRRRYGTLVAPPVVVGTVTTESSTSYRCEYGCPLSKVVFCDVVSTADVGFRPPRGPRPRFSLESSFSVLRLHSVTTPRGTVPHNDTDDGERECHPFCVRLSVTPTDPSLPCPCVPKARRHTTRKLTQGPRVRSTTRNIHTDFIK